MGADPFFAPYGSHFMRAHKLGEAGTAHRIGGIAWKIWKPRSVVDVGCAVGLMLRGLTDAAKPVTVDVIGVDAAELRDAIVEAGPEIPLWAYRWTDLRNLAQMPAWVEGKYDLCICTEVGEHLPPESADGLVKLVTSLSDRILWSAAIPGQTGTQHINEQPVIYWQEKFEQRGFNVAIADTAALLGQIGPVANEPWYRRIRVYGRRA